MTKVVISWLKLFSNWVKRLGGWLLEPRLGWAALLAPLGLFVICWVVLPSWEQRIRITGMLLELLGVVTVAVGLHKTRKLFKQPSLLRAAREWLDRFPLFRRHIVLVPEAGHLTLAGADATAHATVSLSPTASLEERLSALERNLAQTNMSLAETRKKIEQETRDRNSALGSESHHRESGDEETQRMLQEAVASGVYLEMTGVLWLFLGIVLATAPNEIIAVSSTIARAFTRL